MQHTCARAGTFTGTVPLGGWQGHTVDVEYVLYGSSRLGTYQDTLRYDIATPSAYGQYVRWQARRQYELGNHLGNVMLTLSDVKTYAAGTKGAVGYLAKVLTAQQYNPFGMQMPGKNTTLASYSSLNRYRFGFNGMEKDDEVRGAGNALEFGGRSIYDSRLGRFISVDPLERQFPYASPYHYASNNPIYYVDNGGCSSLPWWVQLYLWLTGNGPRNSPRNAEEAQMQDGFRRGLRTGADEMEKRVDKAEEYGSYVPFVGGYMKMTRGLMGQEKVNASKTSAGIGMMLFDAVGGEIARGLFKGIFKIGSKALSPLTEEFMRVAEKFNIKELKITNPNAEKFAVIGQTMERVKAAAGVLEKMGSEIKTFHPTEAAQKEFSTLMEKYAGKTIPDDVVKTTKLFQENTEWINTMKNKGYGIIDVGDDAAKNYKSTFYEMEKTQTYGKKGK